MNYINDSVALSKCAATRKVRILMTALGAELVYEFQQLEVYEFQRLEVRSPQPEILQPEVTETIAYSESLPKLVKQFRSLRSFPIHLPRLELIPPDTYLL